MYKNRKNERSGSGSGVHSNGVPSAGLGPDVVATVCLADSWESQLLVFCSLMLREYGWNKGIGMMDKEKGKE